MSREFNFRIVTLYSEIIFLPFLFSQTKRSNENIVPKIFQDSLVQVRATILFVEETSTNVSRVQFQNCYFIFRNYFSTFSFFSNEKIQRKYCPQDFLGFPSIRTRDNFIRRRNLDECLERSILELLLYIPKLFFYLFFFLKRKDPTKILSLGFSRIPQYRDTRDNFIHRGNLDECLESFNFFFCLGFFDDVASRCQ